MELIHDSDTNTLRLELSDAANPDTLTHTTTIDAILDVGAGGRLIGIEFPSSEAELRPWLDDPSSAPFVTLGPDGGAYIEITSGGDGTSRSTPIHLTVIQNAANELLSLIIPRRGDGYEISYPSGNQ